MYTCCIGGFDRSVVGVLGGVVAVIRGTIVGNSYKTSQFKCWGSIQWFRHLNMKLKARKFTYRGQLLLYTKESLPATGIDLSEPLPGVAGIDVSKKLGLSATNPRDMPLFVQQAEVSHAT